MSETTPKYDSGKPVVLSIVHPDEGLTHVAIPEDTSLSELHSALGQAGYFHPALETKQDGPDASGALENTSDFKNAVRKVWAESQNGNIPAEAAALIQNNGKSIPLPVEPGYKHSMTINQNTFATMHSHPNDREGRPGPDGQDRDVANAKQTHRTFYVVSKSGIWAIAPDGSVTHPYESVGDAVNKNKKAGSK